LAWASSLAFLSSPSLLSALLPMSELSTGKPSERGSWLSWVLPICMVACRNVFDVLYIVPLGSTSDRVMTPRSCVDNRDMPQTAFMAILSTHIPRFRYHCHLLYVFFIIYMCSCRRIQTRKQRVAIRILRQALHDVLTKGHEMREDVSGSYRSQNTHE